MRNSPQEVGSHPHKNYETLVKLCSENHLRDLDESYPDCFRYAITDIFYLYSIKRLTEFFAVEANTMRFGNVDVLCFTSSVVVCLRSSGGDVFATT